MVDDILENLELLSEMLRANGYKVRPVTEGAAALRAAKSQPPDLILLDINMPEMNGYEVCQRLKADDLLKGIPVIFISALGESGDKVKAFQYGGVFLHHQTVLDGRGAGPCKNPPPSPAVATGPRKAKRQP